MHSGRVLQLAVSLPLVGLLSSCGYVHVGRLPVANTVPAVGDAQLSQENADLRLEKKMLQQELALTRAQGEALRRAIENRAADGPTSKHLTERLTETSRELAEVRETLAQLQRDRDAAVASAAESNSLRDRLAQTEQQLAASVRSAAELQHEIAQLRQEVDRTRAENVALSAEVKTLHAQNAEALAALAQLNTDLLSQKDARIRAEQDAETLRSHLQTLAPDASVLAQLRTGAAGEARSLAAEHAAEISALKQQLDTSRGQLATLESERTQLQQHLASLQTTTEDNSLLRDENAQLKAASVQLQATKAELENQLARLKSGSTAQQLQVLREQLHAVQTEANALYEENARLKARVATSASNSNSTAPVRVALGSSPNSPGENADTTEPISTPAPAPDIEAPQPENTSSVTATLITRVPGSPSTSAPRIELPGLGRVHVVAGGDTLSKISARYYGTPSRWGDILNANRDVLGATNNLVIGRTLRIP